MLTLLDTLGGDPAWQPARHAATTAWQQLWDRADAAHAYARQAAGTPGLRAHAAAARALVAAQQDTAMENELIAAIAAAPRWREVPAPSPGWGAASRAWADTSGRRRRRSRNCAGRRGRAALRHGAGS